MFIDPLDREIHERGILARRYPETYDAIYGEEAAKKMQLYQDEIDARIINEWKSIFSSIRKIFKLMFCL